jgi:hypothetical protein
MNHSRFLGRIVLVSACRSCRRFIQTLVFAASLIAVTLCFVNVSSAETYSDMGLTHYLHHKLGFHDYLYGPGGVVPRMTGLPEQVPTQDKVSLLRGTYPVGPYRRPASQQHTVSQNHPAAQNRSSSQHTRIAQRTTPSRTTNASRTTRLDDLNLAVTMPSGPWTRLDPQQSGTRARYLISRGHPTIIISLAGERVGIESNTTNSALLAESQAKMLSLPGGTIQPGGEQLTAGGIPGIAYEATVDQGPSTTHYYIWVASHHGYTYKLAVFGDQTEKPAIDEAMRNFLAGMKQLQSNRVAHASGIQRTITR